MAETCGLKDLAEQSPTKQGLRLHFVFTEINALPPRSPAQACVRKTFLEFGHLPQVQNTASPIQCSQSLRESADLPLRNRRADSLDQSQVQKLVILRVILWGCGGTPGSAAVAFRDLHPGGGGEGQDECGQDFYCLLPLTNDGG